MHQWSTHSGYTIIRVHRFRCNVFLITNGTKHLLIDCGSNHYRRQLLWNLAKLGIDRIDALILTHTHFDHAGNTHYIKNRFGAYVIVHRDEASNLLSGNTPLPKGTVWITRFIVNTLYSNKARLVAYEPCKADLTISNKYGLEKYGIKGYILPTPGHTNGSMSVVVDDEIVLAGDALFGVFPGSTFPPFANDEVQLINSWQLLLDTGARIFMPSHGKPRTRELLQKCYLKRKPTD